MILMPKDYKDLGGEKYYSTMSYKAETKNTLDFAFCGNSDVYSGFSPIEFYEQTGCTSYACSAAKQPAKGVEKNIRFLVKHHKLKLIIIDVDCLFAKNINEGNVIYESANLIAPFKYHARWKELEFKDFYTAPKIKCDPLKGYIPKAAKVKFTLPQDYMSDLNATPAKIEKSVVKNIENIAKMCDENNIKLLFVCLPTPSSWNNAKSNAITNMANELGVPFIDLNFKRDDYDLDYSISFRDKGNHMNIYGATYTTNFLANYLSHNYALPDHRNDEEYKDWNEIIPYYKSHIEALINAANK